MEGRLCQRPSLPGLSLTPLCPGHLCSFVQRPSRRRGRETHMAPEAPVTTLQSLGGRLRVSPPPAPSRTLRRSEERGRVERPNTLSTAFTSQAVPSAA